jgi:hypothetical protein
MKAPEGYKIIRWNSEYEFKKGEYWQIAACVPIALLDQLCEEHCLFNKIEIAEDDDG